MRKNFYVPVDTRLLVNTYVQLYPNDDDIHPRYPNVEADLLTIDDNANHVVAFCCEQLSAAGVPDAEIGEFIDEAISGNYPHVLETCMKWVNMPVLREFVKYHRNNLDSSIEDLSQMVQEIIKRDDE